MKYCVTKHFFIVSDLNVLRVEAVPPGWFEYNRAFSVVTEFYGNLENTSIDSSKRAEGINNNIIIIFSTKSFLSTSGGY